VRARAAIGGARAIAPGRRAHAGGRPALPMEQRMDVSLWMTRALLTVAPETPLHAAARCMAEHRVRHLLVVAPQRPRHLLGIVSTHDLYRATDAGVNPFSPRAHDARAEAGGTVGAIMTAHPLTIPSATPLAEAARVLRDRKFGCLPVVDRGELVGVLTENDILRAFVRWTGADEPGYDVACVAPPHGDALGALGALAAARGLHVVSAAAFDHDGRRLLAVHFAGADDEAFVDDLWRSGHTILRVRRTGGRAVPPAART
jgi:acetoin utilization protein AcuB